MGDPLAYASPHLAADDPRRRSACAHVAGNGRGCVAFGTVLLLIAIAGLVLRPPGGRIPWLEVSGFAFYGTLFLSGGIFFSVGSHQLRLPSRRLENIVVMIAVVLIASLVPLTGWMAQRALGVSLMLLIPVAMAVMTMASLAWCIYKVRLLRRIP